MGAECDPDAVGAGYDPDAYPTQTTRSARQQAYYTFRESAPLSMVTPLTLLCSVRYHRLHPEYVHGRISKLGSAYLLRVLLVSVDVDDHQEVLKELTKVAVVNNLTIMLAWSCASPPSPTL